MSTGEEHPDHTAEAASAAAGEGEAGMETADHAGTSTAAGAGAADTDAGGLDDEDRDAADSSEDTGKSEIERLQEELDERTDDVKRVSAEFANFRRRTDRERQAAADNAKASIVLKFLALADDLDLAAKHGDLEAGPLKAFADKFTSVLSSLGVEPFGEKGEVFDFEKHQAVQDLSTGDDKVLVEILNKGYRMGERNLRLPMVIVGDPTE